MPNRDLAIMTDRLEDKFEDIVTDSKDHQSKQNDHPYLLCIFQNLSEGARPETIS